MANIYELTGAYKYLETLIEMNPADEDLIERLKTLNDDIEDKADNYARLIRNIESEVDGLDNEMRRLAERKASRMNAIKRLKENLMMSMKQTGKTKFKTDLFSFSVAKNGGKQPLVIDVPAEDMPDELVTIKREVSKDALRDYITETGDLSYGHFEEKGEHLNIR